MIAVDTNILVYAHHRESPFHSAALNAVGRLARGGAPWAIPWPCLHEFYGVMTRPGVFVNLMPPETAVQAISVLLAHPHLVTLAETDRHWDTLQNIMVDARVIGARVHDARIAAICIDHGVRELWSADRDFKQFSGLKVVNPLRG